MKPNACSQWRLAKTFNTAVVRSTKGHMPKGLHLQDFLRILYHIDCIYTKHKIILIRSVLNFKTANGIIQVEILTGKIEKRIAKQYKGSIGEENCFCLRVCRSEFFASAEMRRIFMMGLFGRKRKVSDSPKKTTVGIPLIVETAKNIDWSSLECCGHRKCEDRSVYLADLCSNNPKVRNNAYWRFDNHVVVQAGLYNSAFYVIPFVIQLLKENMKHNRHNRELYNLLFELGNGCGSGDVEFSIVTEPFTYYVPKAGGIKWSLTEACYNAVFAGWNVYYEELMNTNSPNRKYAFELISQLYRNNIVIRNTALQQLIDREPDSEIGKLAADEIKEALYPYTSPLYPQ